MLNANDLVQVHLYTSEEGVIQDALRLLLRERPADWLGRLPCIS